MLKLKFPYSEEYLKRFLTYRDSNIMIYEPKKNSGELYCYAEMWDEEYEKFIQHFGISGEIIQEHSKEWPASMDSYNNGRLMKFNIRKFAK